MLHATLYVNHDDIGTVEIERRKDQVDPPSPDAYLTYDYTIRRRVPGGIDVHDGVLRHRYSDGAWALVALAIDAAGLWPLWNRQTAEMAEIRRRNQKTIDRNLEILSENAVLRTRLAEKSAEVNDKSDVGHAVANAWQAEAERLQAQRDEVLKLHYPTAPPSWEVGAGQRWCEADGRPWPCDTARALGVTA